MFILKKDEYFITLLKIKTRRLDCKSEEFLSLKKKCFVEVEIIEYKDYKRGGYCSQEKITDCDLKDCGQRTKEDNIVWVLTLQTLSRSSRKSSNIYHNVVSLY